MATTAQKNPMDDHESSILFIGFIVIIIIVAVLCSCARQSCPAYDQVGNMKPLNPYHAKR